VVGVPSVCMKHIGGQVPVLSVQWHVCPDGETEAQRGSDFRAWCIWTEDRIYHQ
jgi:hypothetical protein